MDKEFGELVELLFKVYGAIHSGVFGAGKRGEERGRLDVGTLGFLSHNGKSSLSETARALRVSRPQMSVLADRLVERGWIARTRDEGDRRVQWVAITSEGKAELKRSLKATGERVHEFLVALDPDEVASIKASLVRLVDVLGERHR